LRSRIPPAASVATAESVVSDRERDNLLDQSGRYPSSDPNPAVVAGRPCISALVLTYRRRPDHRRLDTSPTGLKAQNLNSSDLTLISAGRDFNSPTTINSRGYLVVGPCTTWLSAGSERRSRVPGYCPRPQPLNANLPTANGADIHVMAGLVQSPYLAGRPEKIGKWPSAADQARSSATVENLSVRRSLPLRMLKACSSAYIADQQRDLLNHIYFHDLGFPASRRTPAGAGVTEATLSHRCRMFPQPARLWPPGSVTVLR